MNQSAQGKSPNPIPGLFDPKFDIALNLCPTRAYLKAIQELDPVRLSNIDTRRLLESCSLQEIQESQVGVEIIAKLFTLGHSYSPTARSELQLDSILTTSNRGLVLQEDHLVSNCSSILRDEIKKHQLNDTARLKSPPLVIRRLWSFIMDFEGLMSIVKHHTETEYKVGQSEDPEGPSPLYPPTSSKFRRPETETKFTKHFLFDPPTKLFSASVSRQWILLRLNGQLYLLSKDQVTMIHNKLLELFNAYLIAWMFSGTVWTPGFFRKQCRLIQWMINLVLMKGNRSYSIFKSLDGICVGEILRMEDKFDNSAFQQEIFSSLRKEVGLTTGHIAELQSILHGLPAQEVLELSGMAKSLGHPDVESLAGLKKLYERVTRRNIVAPEQVAELLNVMILRFCQVFYYRHKKWPLLEFQPGVNPRIVEYCLKNQWPTGRENDPWFSAEDFTFVTLQQNVSFDSVQHLFPILKDTALALPLSYLDISSGPDYSFNGLKKAPIALRRTLLAFLQSRSPHDDVDKYLVEYCSRSPLAMEHMVIKLTQKERELKVDPRCFGASDFVERIRRCILEYNLADLMDKYNVGQAMTLSELKKYSRMMTLSELSKSHPDYHLIIFSVDVEGWNNAYRRQFCEPIGKHFFDPLTGTKMFHCFMDVFELSTFYASDGEGHYSWTGQLGGIEGLAQKAWSWIYETIAATVSDQTGFPYHLMVNGDDLRIVLQIPKVQYSEPELPEVISAICRSFKNAYKGFGFNLKLEETYASTSLLGFSKVYILNRSFLTSTLKKGVKLHGLANLMGDLPLEYIKGVFSETTSTMSTSVNHRFIYLVGLINVYRWWYLILPDFHKLTMHQKLCFIFLPTNFGGFPSLPYCRTLAKGDSDLETMWVSFYKWLLVWDPILGEMLVRIVSYLLMRSNDYGALASNCYTLPTRTVQDGQAFLRQELRKLLPSLTMNTYFKRVLTKASPQRTRRFIRSVYSTNLIQGKAFSVIVETSLPGLVEEFVQKFESARSIMLAVRSKRGLRRARQLIVTAKKKDMARISRLVTLLKTKSLNGDPNIYRILKDKNKCPTQMMDELREYCWKKKVIGVTYPSPVDQVSVLTQQDINWQSSTPYPDAFTVWIEPLCEEVNMLYSRGSSEVFLGFHTSLKVCPSEIPIHGDSPCMRRVEKLLQVYPLLRRLGKQMEEYIIMNLTVLTGIPGQLWLSCAWKYISGSISHRLPANHWSPVVGPNELCNRSSYLNRSGSTDRVLRNLAGDWTINYGYLFAFEICWALYVTEFCAFQGPTPSSITFWMKIDHDCDYCLQCVEDQELTWTEPPPLIDFDIGYNPYYGFQPKEKIDLERALRSHMSSVLQTRVRHLDKQNPADLGLAQLHVAQELLDELKSPASFPIQGGMTYSASQMMALYAVQKFQALGLTELKHIPAAIFLTALYNSFTSWTFDHYPHLITRRSPHLIGNLSRQYYPFEAISQAIYEAGYWDCLKPHLRMINPHVYLALPRNPADLQRRLVELLVSKFTTELHEGKVLTMTRFHQITLALLGTDDEILLRAQYELTHLKAQVLRNWIQTTNGRALTSLLHQGHYEACDHLLGGLYLLRSIPVTMPEILTEEIVPLFSLAIDQEDPWIFVQILRYSGVDARKIQLLTHLNQNRFLNFDLTTINREGLGLPELTETTYRFDLVRRDEVIGIVRDTENIEYKLSITRFPLPKLPSEAQLADPVHRPRRGIPNETPRFFLSEALNLRFTNKELSEINKLQLTRIGSSFFSDPSPSISQSPLDQTICLRCFGCSTSSPSKIFEILLYAVGLSPLELGAVVCAGDLRGGFTRVCVTYFTKASIIYNSLSNDFPAGGISVPDLDGLPPKTRERVLLSNVERHASDLTDPTTASAICAELSPSPIRIFFLVVSDVQVYSDSETNDSILETLKLILKYRGRVGASAIIKTSLTHGSHFLSCLKILAPWFESWTIVKPLSSWTHSNEVYLIFSGFKLINDQMGLPILLPEATLATSILAFKTKLEETRRWSQQGLLKFSWKWYERIGIQLSQHCGLLPASYFTSSLGEVCLDLFLHVTPGNLLMSLSSVSEYLERTHLDIIVSIGDISSGNLRSEEGQPLRKRRRVHIHGGHIRHSSRLLLEIELLLRLINQLKQDPTGESLFNLVSSQRISLRNALRNWTPSDWNTPRWGSFSHQVDTPDQPSGAESWWDSFDDRVIRAIQLMWVLIWKCKIQT